MSFSSLTRGKDLSDAHLSEACGSSQAMEMLLERFAAVARPNDGAERLFDILGRLATAACGWVDGDVRVEMWGNVKTTTVSILTSLGGGFREKLFGDLRLAVPFEEIGGALRATPALADPLRVRENARRIVLTGSRESRHTSMPPPVIAFDPSCYFDESASFPDPELARKQTLPLAGGAPKVAERAPRIAMPAGTEPRIVLRRRVRSDGEG